MYGKMPPEGSLIMENVAETRSKFITKSKRLAKAIKMLEGDRKLQEIILSVAKIKRCKKCNLIIKLADCLRDAS